jgi:hypothetical protein
VDRPVRKGGRERVVDQPVLLDERELGEAVARDRDLEMVAAAGPILDGELARIGERVAEQRFQGFRSGHAIIVAVGRRATFLASLPERTLRALVGTLGGAVHETAQVVLPRFARRSRLYEATAKNMLRLAIELVGAVERPAEAAALEADELEPGELMKRKVAGNVVELGSIAAFGFSPLWLLAGAPDVLHGSRVYLDVLADELRSAGVLSPDAQFTTVDELLAALEGGSGTTARLVDVPPLELAELRASLGELRAQAADLPSPDELAGLFAGLRQTAARERLSLLEVSSGMGLAFLLSARRVGREHLVTPYREDWQPLREEGFGAYAARVAQPYREAVAGHFDPERSTWTERTLDRLR